MKDMVNGAQPRKILKNMNRATNSSTDEEFNGDIVAGKIIWQSFAISKNERERLDL